MDIVNQLILVAAALLLISILVSVPSRRVGMPLLLVFLALGMLAGAEGPGALEFDNYQAAYLIGSVALAIILFDGGLGTRATTFRVGLRPALSLATLGVIITAAVTGLVASLVFELNWLQGLLLGAIVGSTDAAAVFGLLHAQGLRLKERVSATLEIESGANDPMAIFLTLALVELVAAGATRLDSGVLVMLVQQMGLGLVLGYGGGRLLVYVINRLPLATSLYPLLALAGALVIFSGTLNLGGSGFLAVYVAGLVLGNRPLQANLGIQRFHDGIAWLAQIGMFLMLGLLVTPSALLAVALPALAVALALILIARPLAVFISLLPFGFPLREQIFVGWVGLRGAVPIILALFPLLADLPNAQRYFNVAFFVVLVSLILQGWTLAPLARRLGLEVPTTPGWHRRLELDLPGQLDYEMVVYVLSEDSPALGETPATLRVPPGVGVAGLIRDHAVIAGCEAVRLAVGDHLLLLARSEDVEALDKLLTTDKVPEHLRESRFFGEFVLDGHATLGDVAGVYGVEVPADSRDSSLAEVLARAFKRRPVVGDRLPLGNLELVVREMEGETITRVGLKLTH
ncbi:potassium/proton antiporter [Thiohalobacter thiocyanaticus]|uniref:Potassium/proton antiporter n=1 Tax=Thiohalobacter thiocyanaticus TaxID=585455 RepID=A0A426QJA3_9GAMM|nr:potassium/proton antiporter [Thiohalobacter thiocyanaticus]RRQ21844.1 potassium/proton antiporter [Thiohalobacter thiocyanaticus]